MTEKKANKTAQSRPNRPQTKAPAQSRPAAEEAAQPNKFGARLDPLHAVRLHTANQEAGRAQHLEDVRAARRRARQQQGQ